MNACMTPVHVRFTPDADELDKLKRAMTPAGPARPIPLWLCGILGAFQFAPGALELWRHGFATGSRFNILSVIWIFQMCLGAAWVPLYYALQRTFARLSLSLRPGIEVDLTIDDAGITITEPRARRLSWKDVLDVRDFGEAFVIRQRRGASLPIFKRALTGRGTELWAALDAKLSARRYLVRSTLGPPTIYNRLAPPTLQ